MAAAATCSADQATVGDAEGNRERMSRDIGSSVVSLDMERKATAKSMHQVANAGFVGGVCKRKACFHTHV